eukprot:3149021-Rhodomonas_salina.1
MVSKDAQNMGSAFVTERYNTGEGALAARPGKSTLAVTEGRVCLSLQQGSNNLRAFAQRDSALTWMTSNARE